MVGSLGSELVALAKLSLYIARFNYHKVDCSSMKVFDESMRGLYRLSGLEGQPAATVFTVSVYEYMYVFVSVLVCVHTYMCMCKLALCCAEEIVFLKFLPRRLMI